MSIVLETQSCVSTAWELRIDENSSTVDSVSVLRNVCDFQVKLSFTHFFCNLWINFCLSNSVCRLVQCFAMLFISVLLCAPHQRLFLSCNFKCFWVKRLNDWIYCVLTFVNFGLSVFGQFVKKIIRWHKLIKTTSIFRFKCFKNFIKFFLSFRTYFDLMCLQQQIVNGYLHERLQIHPKVFPLLKLFLSSPG